MKPKQAISAFLVCTSAFLILLCHGDVSRFLHELTFFSLCLTALSLE